MKGLAKLSRLSRRDLPSSTKNHPTIYSFDVICQSNTVYTAADGTNGDIWSLALKVR